MAVSHKDSLELLNWKIWLAEIDIEIGLEFLIQTDILTGFAVKKLQT